MTLHFGRPEPLDFETLVCETPDREFNNLTRSTVPLLAYWKSHDDRLEKICHQLGLHAPPDDMRLCFEYPVSSVGRAKASFTDIMAVSQSLCVAIEGKSTEGNYDSVKKWLGKGGDSRPPVLKHWLQLIANRTGIPIPPIDFSRFDDVTYQMIHRTASACSLNKPRTVVVYQVFDINGKLPDYKRKLTELASAIGAAGKIDILLNIIKSTPTKEFKIVEGKIKNLKMDETAQFVRAAILDGSLFEFDDKPWVSVSTVIGQ